MFIKTIKSDDLAHLSYLLVSGSQAAVIDPRRDCSLYATEAAAAGARITHIFETHRHEDFLSGAAALSDMTGADVYHGENADGEVEYAQTVKEGDSFKLGHLKIKVIATPGHTKDSVCYALYDTEFGEDAVGVFTGDTLFIGDVGRTDFYPDQKAEMAGQLFDSLQKLKALGDQVIIYPAHGAGSVCGDAMADREFSTLGYERFNNPGMKLTDRDEFIDKKTSESHPMPPYFNLMERLNLSGASPMPAVQVPPALDLAVFKAKQKQARVIDVRGVADFIGAHVPGSLALPADMVAAYAGWLLEPDTELLLVAKDADQAQLANTSLLRTGFEGVVGFLSPAITGWAHAAEPFTHVHAIEAKEVERRLSTNDNWQLLDVRSEKEFSSGHIDGAKSIFLGDLPEQLDQLDRQQAHTVLCESGARATIGASILLAAGFKHVDVFLGAMGAWRNHQS